VAGAERNRRSIANPVSFKHQTDRKEPNGKHDLRVCRNHKRRRKRQSGNTPKTHKDGKLFTLTKRFCKSINGNSPVFLPFTDMNLTGDGFGGGECHSNVEWLVRQRGGRAQFGWCIWQESTRILDAEFHCVWINTTGEMLDVSPRLGNEEFMLFLPDDVRRFDWMTMTTCATRMWWPREKRYQFWDFNSEPTKHKRVRVIGKARVLPLALAA
jgi:hypothetical protein